ncbi:MAG: hypothetical protein GXO86_03215 [Chlorobi bacterium]|nr:hypothetical protein [Chlorobiota bacterium]
MNIVFGNKDNVTGEILIYNHTGQVVIRQYVNGSGHDRINLLNETAVSDLPGRLFFSLLLFRQL